MLSPLDALVVPPTKLPLDGTTFVVYVLPPVICYFVLAVLSVTPQTHAIRVALWPLIALFASRAVLSVELSHGKIENKHLDAAFVLSMLFATTRSFDWTLAKEPLVRRIRPRNSSPSTIMDAIDLCIAFRGHGWEWSGKLYVPRETRPANRIPFLFHVLLSAIVHALIFGVCQRAVWSLIPIGAGISPKGSTLFDDNLPFFLRYFRVAVVSVFGGVATYAGMQMSYDLCTMPAVLFLRQDPAQWPPAFDAPWCATSLTDFWGRRWHQFHRRTYLLFGGYPLSLVLGRPGIVIGAFLASAAQHHATLLTFNSEANMWWMLVGFGMMAPGVLAEEAFRRWTGKRVAGVVGWIWTMAWLLLWGSIMFEGFARVPMHRSSLLDNVAPVGLWVDRMAIGFDDWLYDMCVD